jgi:hypothetical protein
VARLVDARRLAGGPDEESREQVGQRGVVLPVEDQRAQQIRTPQEGAVHRGGAAHDHVVAAAGARVAPVDHELVGAQARLACHLVHGFGGGHALAPAGRRVDVHLDDAGVGRHADDVQARVVGRRITLDVHRQAQLFGGGLGRGDQLEVVLDALHGRHEHAQASVTGLGGEGGAHAALELYQRLLAAILARLVGPHARAGQLSPGGGRQARGRLDAAHDVVVVRQRLTLFRGVRGVDVRIGLRRHEGQRREGQAVAHRAVSGDQEQVLAPQLPALRAPARALVLGLPALDGQHEARRRGEPAREHPRDASALLGALQLRVLGGHVLGQLGLGQDPAGRVFERRRHVLGAHRQVLGHDLQELLGVLGRGARVLVFARDELGQAPDGHVVPRQ